MIQPKTPFFQPKKLLYITTAIFAAYILLWAGLSVKNKYDKNQKSRVAKNSQQQVENLSHEQLAIKKAQDHLVNSISAVGTSERIFISYLQRKFNLPRVLGADGPPIDLYEDPRTYPSEVHYLARIAYPDKIVKELPKFELDDGVKVTNIYSANCDHIPLPGNYWQTVDQNISTGGYYAAHVVLALEFMKDNGCPLPANVVDISNRVAQVLAKLADDPNAIADLRYEAVAFLLLSGKDDLVKPEWIDRIISEQRASGGWSKEVGGAKDDYHATLLAFWALLEHSRPNTSNEPFIRRPSQS
jgi:hypothetical protein